MLVQDIFGVLTNGQEWGLYKYEQGGDSVSYEVYGLSISQEHEVFPGSPGQAAGSPGGHSQVPGRCRGVSCAKYYYLAGSVWQSWNMHKEKEFILGEAFQESV